MSDKMFFEIVAERSISVLPRVLQVLSRRGFLVEELSTENLPRGMCKLSCTVSGPAHWHKSIPGLLGKLVEVQSVQVVMEGVGV